MLAQYIWLDHNNNIRTKTKVVYDSIKEWSYDGSSTEQSKSTDSDLILKPVSIFHASSPIVVCEVFTNDDVPHPDNYRRKLVNELKRNDIQIGFEQEYMIGTILNHPFVFTGEPQGEFYCSTNNYGFDLMEEHVRQCLKYGIKIYGMNSEVMPCQHEFQLCPLNPF